MKVTGAFFLAMLLLAGLGVSGCSESETGQLDKGYMATAEELGKTRKELFDKAKGDFDALSPEDKQKFINTFESKSEESARKYWDVIKNPPTAGRATGAPR